MNLDKLRIEAANCTLCDLHLGRISPVFAKGNPNAKIMICGMCPADEENKAGIPFVGRAGKLLDLMLEASGLSLQSVYITNLVKCYLAAGKLLDQDWINSCLPYIIAQISIMKPRVIITLGADASNTLLNREPRSIIGGIKGNKFEYAENISLVPTYHPSYVVRKGGQSSSTFPGVVKDFIMARSIVGL